MFDSFLASTSIFLVLKPHFGQAIPPLLPKQASSVSRILGKNANDANLSLLFDGRFNYAEKLLGVFLRRSGRSLYDLHWIFSLCRHSQLVVLCERVLLDNAGKVDALFF